VRAGSVDRTEAIGEFGMNKRGGWAKMLRAVLAVMAMAGLLVAVDRPASARDSATTRAAITAVDAYAQQPRTRRAPTRIRVTPRCPYRSEASLYPPAADCDYPGPGFVRQCEARLVQENRPSGTVLFPRMWCWWQPG
jgi:hypothetical protein